MPLMPNNISIFSIPCFLIINGETKNIPKSLNKDELLERIKETYLINEKSIKKLSKDSLVNLAKLLDIVFYRGRFRMKIEDATKNNLINKIVIDKKNKPLETPQKALTIDRYLRKAVNSVWGKKTDIDGRKYKAYSIRKWHINKCKNKLGEKPDELANRVGHSLATLLEYYADPSDVEYSRPKGLTDSIKERKGAISKLA